MKNTKELDILFQIGTGITEIEALVEKSPENVRFIVNQLLKDGKIHTKNKLTLTKKGLLTLSRLIINQEFQRSSYTFCSNNGLPYFLYTNTFQKDTIFHPGLFFDPARNYLDEQQFLVYKTSMSVKGFSLIDLEILYNLLYEYEYFHPTGFWLIKCEKVNLCGWGVENLRDTLKIAEKPFELKFCYGFSDFIFIITSAIKKFKLSKTRINIYITRDIFPYVDTLDGINDSLGVFMNYHEIQLPRGKEIKLKKRRYWKGLPEPRLQFFPKILGKILHGSGEPHILFPYVIIMTPFNTNTKLKQISPWFVTCPGGFLEEELSTEKAQYVHLMQLVSLPEIDIVTLMTHTTN